MTRKKLDIMNVKSEDLLSRQEMKHILAGSGTPQSSCEYDGCEGASQVFNCWYGECSNYYSGQDAIDCVNEVGESHQFAIATCGSSYS